MEQPQRTVNDYITELKKNPIIKSVCDLTQTVGGFDVNTTDETTLKYLEVENVYKRLGVLAVNNLIAVSELIKDVPGNVVYNNTGIVPTNICGCETDTGFVMIPTETPKKYPDHIRVESIGTGSNKIKIASIHLPGDGPIKKNESIRVFLNNNLENIKDDNVDVVCGDTNITVAKSMYDGANREKEICSFFYTFFGAPCLILMSNIRVGKHRRGFMLRNQQLQKSVPDSHIKSEADGTIMAIRLRKDETDETVAAILRSLGEHITCVYQLNGSAEPKLISGIQEEVVALQFKKPIDQCVDVDGKPTENVWLDHSVLYVPFTDLCSLIGKICDMDYPRNLIVVNMGSIVNSGKKNWNTQYINKTNEIKEADMAIYNLIRNFNPDKELPEYINIIGSSMSKPNPGIDDTKIFGPDTLTHQIVEIAERLKATLTKSVHNGGNYKTNRRLSNRRYNRFYNKKNNTKRVENKYRY